jgi:hypothetical protein
MAKQSGVWIKGLTKDNKTAIVMTCERFIAEVMIPRFLPEIRPTEFNYPIAITGKWRGDKFSFVQHYRSGFADNTGEEFDSAFARLDFISGDCLDLMWHRHTGQWLCFRAGVSLAEALRLIAKEELLQPN